MSSLVTLSFTVFIEKAMNSNDEGSDNVDSSIKTATFTVAEYSLPKFEVKITPPPYLLMDATTAMFKICANYTFGKPVTGTLKVNTTLSRYHWETLPLPMNTFETKVGFMIYMILFRFCYSYIYLLAIIF